MLIGSMTNAPTSRRFNRCSISRQAIGLPSTDTELSDIASAAIIGDSSSPVTG